MTAPTPIQHGYVDYGRFAARSDTTIVNLSGVVATAAKVYGPYFVGNLDHIFVIATCGSVRIRVTARWTPDSASAGPAINDTLVGKAADLIEVPLAVKGHYVQFTVDLAAYTNNFDLQVVAIPHLSNGILPTGRNILISQDGAAVAGGATAQYDAVYVRGGWAVWNAVLDAAVSWRTWLYVMNFDGTFTMLDMNDFNASKHNRLVMIPPLPVRIQVFNNDAGGHNAYVSVVFHPFEP